MAEGTGKKKGSPSTHSDSEEESGTSGSSEPMDMLKFFMSKLKLSSSEEEKPEKLLDEVSFDGVVRYIKSDKCKNIIAMVGAGISTSAGIPDFRSPSSGIYANLKKYRLPSPECMFDINFFRERPEPFYDLAKELFPGKFKPTPCHYFLKLMCNKQMLLRLYTQNIDTLERVAGIPEDKLIEAHGTFYTSHCLESSCRAEYSLDWMKEKIFSSEVPVCTKCGSYIKPDIVFFGEHLPDRFFDCVQQDFSKCDLLLIIGTSLSVQPFSGLVDNVPVTTPRLLINKEKCGQANEYAMMLGYESGLNFDPKTNYRDVSWLGLCDDGCQALAEALGWGDELKALVEEQHKRIDRESPTKILLEAHSSKKN